MINRLFSIIILTIISINSTIAQKGTDLESTSLAVEHMLDEAGTESIERFIDRYMVSEVDQDVLIEKIITIREELEGLRDGIGLDLDEMGAILTLSARGVEKRLRIMYDRQKQKVTDLKILPTEEKLIFNKEDLEAAVQFMKEKGMAGLLYLKSDGKILMKEPFGMANDMLDIVNSTTTIFAVGSRPIDFTIASILLLDQRGLLSLDDSIDDHLNDVPSDKKGITIKHLMSGQSGLPDFFDNENDWDPDLQWVSRDEAIHRMMNQTLLFRPGTGNSHSHGAFGLLAAIIEIKTGKTYMEFLHENFFDPAGMSRTGEYGEKKDFQIKDFAVGGGPQYVGLPNIPPNWGPTSWLVKGSGGMYSTLDDLLKFYSFVRSGKVLDDDHAKYFKGQSANVDGSMRGFELFSTYLSPTNELFLFLNKAGKENERRKIFRALENLLH